MLPFDDTFGLLHVPDIHGQDHKKNIRGKKEECDEDANQK